MLKLKTRFEKLKKHNLPNTKDEAKKYKHNYIIKLNYNENKFGATPKLNGAIEINSPNIYPEFRDHKLIEELSKRFSLSKDHFYISNGSDAILDSIPTLFASASNGHNVIVPELTFGRIETTCLVNDIDIKKVNLTNGKIDLDKFYRAIDNKTRIIYIVNPNMPTGTFNKKDELIKFIDKVPSNILIIIDGAYSEYALGIDKSIALDKELISEYDNVLITHTFSKLYGIASFRVGYAIAKPYIVDLFDRALQALPVNKYSLQAATIVMQDKKFYDNIIKKTNDEIKFLYKEYDELGLEYLKTNGNFIYVKTENLKLSNKEIRQFVLEDTGVMIRSVRDNALRITVGTHDENVKLIDSLRKLFNKNA